MRFSFDRRKFCFNNFMQIFGKTKLFIRWNTQIGASKMARYDHFIFSDNLKHNMTSYVNIGEVSHCCK
jgi:hypothetical protein